MLDLRPDLGTAEAKIDFIGQHQAREGAARDLFAAAVRECLEVGIEPMREAERHGRNRRRRGAEFRMHRARYRQLELFREVPTPDFGHERRRWSYTHGRTQLAGGVADAGREPDLARAE